MRKLLPVILTLLGLAAGGGAGFLLQPSTAAPEHAGEGAAEPATEAADGHGGEAKMDAGHAAEAAPASDGHGGESKPAPDDSIEVIEGTASGGHGAEGEAGGFDYVKLSNQFVVPLVENGQVKSMMVLSLSLEVKAGGGDAVFAREPKLRDALLQVLFDHANANGFGGRYTDAEAMLPLRRALREAAMKVLPDTVNDVLISDIVRHDS